MRIRTACATVIAMIGGLVACGTDEPAAATLLIFGSPDEVKAYRTLIDEYHRATGERVELREASSDTDLLTTLSTSIAGGSPPDLFLMNYREYGQFVAKDAVEPVDQRLASSSAFKATDFHAKAMAAFQWGGEQMCMPQNISSLAVYYNRELFKKVGMTEPRADWTWNDMIATAQALTLDAGGRPVKGAEPELGAVPAVTHGLGIDPELIRLAPFVWSNGGTLVDNPERPTRLTLDDPRSKEAMTEFLRLHREYGVTPLDEEVEAQTLSTRFSKGRLAMYVSSRRATTTFRSEATFDWDVAPLPRFGERPANILHSDAYCMTKGSKNKDAAWRYLEYALGEKGAAIISKTGRTVPSMTSLSNSPVFLEPGAKPANSRVWLDAIPNLQYTPAISTWPEIEEITGDLLENAFYRGDQLDTVIKELDTQTRPLFAKANEGR